MTIGSLVLVLGAVAFGAVLNEDLEFRASDVSNGGSFGTSLDVDGSTLIVGSPRSGDPGAAAYIFDVASPVAPVEELRLSTGDGLLDDEFGFRVAVRGATAVVTAPMDDDGGNGAGAAYVFDAVTGQQHAKIFGLPASPGARFGRSLDMEGSIAIVGAPEPSVAALGGAAFLFDVSNPSGPVKLATLSASDLVGGSRFGVGVAIKGSTAVVSANGTDQSGGNAGAVYVFDITDPSNPIQTHRLVASDAQNGDELGTDVSLENGLIAAYSSRITMANPLRLGLVVLFDAQSGAELGRVVSGQNGISGSFTKPFLSAGKLLMRLRTTGSVGRLLELDISDPSNPVPINRLEATDGNTSDNFARAAVRSGTTTFVGASTDSDVVSFGGSVYVFDPGVHISCEGDFDGDGDTDVIDFGTLAGNFGAGPGATPEQGDFTGDGFVDVFDFAAFVDVFGCGAPGG